MLKTQTMPSYIYTANFGLLYLIPSFEISKFYSENENSTIVRFDKSYNLGNPEKQNMLILLFI